MTKQAVAKKSIIINVIHETAQSNLPYKKQPINITDKGLSIVNNTTKIEPITEQELPKIIEIEQSAHVSPWTNGVIEDCFRRDYFWVLKLNDNIVGYIVFTLHNNECEILNLCIKPEQQHLGYGAKLLQKTIHYAKQQKASSVFLEVRQSNRTAINLYLKLGFNETGIRKNYYHMPNGREDAILLAREIE